MERSISRRGHQLGLNQRRSKLPKGVAVAMKRMGRPVAIMAGESEGLANGVHVRGFASASEEQRYYYEEREYLLALLGC